MNNRKLYKIDMVFKIICIRYSIVFLLLTILITSDLAYAKRNYFYTFKGFINDNYGTSFYYDEDNCYNDGWHLIDDNGDGMYEYYYFSLSGHMLKDAIAPNGYLLNQYGKFI